MGVPSPPRVPALRAAVPPRGASNEEEVCMVDDVGRRPLDELRLSIDHRRAAARRNLPTTRPAADPDRPPGLDRGPPRVGLAQGARGSGRALGRARRGEAAGPALGGTPP